MKFTRVMSMSAIGFLTLLAMPVRPAAQESPSTHPPSARYTVVDLGPLEGGSFSQPFFMSKSGVVSGSSGLSNNTQHAVLWFTDYIADIGTLGGPNSIAFDVNEMNHAIGEAETSASDPNGEDFCGFGTHLTCAPFRWESDVMTPLPTLGGNNGVANQISDLGLVVGFAENTTTDPACPAPQIFQFKPALWTDGKVKELPTLAGDPDGVALSSNEIGQVVGASGICTTFNFSTLFNLQPVHPLLWQKGKAIDLGSLGGTTGQAGGNIAWGINNHGQVVGVSDLVGDTAFHAFLWTTAHGMQDLGTLTGDFASAGSSINDRGEGVGVSLDASFNGRAFLWQSGVMKDLNTLVPPGSLSLISGCSINSRGEIAGLALTSTGEFHAYRAIPVQQ